MRLASREVVVVDAARWAGRPMEGTTNACAIRGRGENRMVR
jgi:hypothetical protein